jgi:hypothetical protein
VEREGRTVGTLTAEVLGATQEMRKYLLCVIEESKAQQRQA